MEYLRIHEDADRIELICGVADGLQYLHSMGVVHGDMKGANILVATHAHPVLADFGLSVNEAQNTQGLTTTQAFAGTTRWMAPERLDPEQYGLNGRTSRTFASDVYSFGMTIYEIYANRAPFYELSDPQVVVAATTGKRPEHPGDDAEQRGLTPTLWTFVTRCWDHRPSARPNLTDRINYRDALSNVNELGQIHPIYDEALKHVPPGRVIEAIRTGDRPVATGGSGVLWRGKRTSDEMDVALKGLRLNAGEIKLLELSIWSELEHQNVLPFLGLCLQPTSRVQYLVSPWELNGNIIEYLVNNDSADRRQLIMGIAEGLMYLHGRGIVHGDVKGANILVASDGQPLLADFGLDLLDWHNMQGQVTTQALAGGARWMAPERLDPKPYGLNSRTSRTIASDVYSFAITIYEIYSGRLPFDDTPVSQVAPAVISGTRPSHPGDEAIRRGLAPDLWLFVTECWDPDPWYRRILGDVTKFLDGSLGVNDVMDLRVRGRRARGRFERVLDVYQPCPSCNPGNPDDYACEHPIPNLERAGASERRKYAWRSIPKGHSECFQCYNLVPVRKGVKSDCCVVCKSIHCNNIYGSCTSWNKAPGPLKPLEEWFLDESPAATMVQSMELSLFYGNSVERTRLEYYLTEMDWTCADFIASIMQVVGGQGLRRALWQGPALAEDPQVFQLSDWTCRSCAHDLIQGNIIEWYVQQREKDDLLRALFSRRPDCPNGVACPDAMRDIKHRSRLNHICGPTFSQAPERAGHDIEDGRGRLKATDSSETFRTSFLPEQITFRDTRGAPCFMVTIYHDDGTSTPGKATLSAWDGTGNQDTTHFTVYTCEDDRELYWEGQSSFLHETESTKWVRCQDGRLGQFSFLHETGSMKWVRCQDGRLPSGNTPVIGGRRGDGKELGHAAVWWKGRRIPGQADFTARLVRVSWADEEFRLYEEYDVLCWK